MTKPNGEDRTGPDSEHLCAALCAACDESVAEAVAKMKRAAQRHRDVRTTMNRDDDGSATP